MPETVVAAVVGSFACNVTMTLGAAAIARPIGLSDPSLVRAPWLAMLGSLALVVVLASSRCQLTRTHGAVSPATYHDAIQSWVASVLGTGTVRRHGSNRTLPVRRSHL